MKRDPYLALAELFEVRPDESLLMAAARVASTLGTPELIYDAAVAVCRTAGKSADEQRGEFLVIVRKARTEQQRALAVERR